MLRSIIWYSTISCFAAVGGCRFPDLPALDEDGNAVDAAPTDTAVDAEVDAPFPCQPDTIDCDEGTDVYTECSSEGIATLQMQCPLGCASDMEKCVDVDPSNGLATYLDMAATAPDLVLTGTSTINPYDGTILVGAVAVQVPNFTTDGIRVFVVRSLSVEGTVNVSRRYASPSLAFVSHGDVTVSGLLDISAQGAEGGAGGMWGGDQSAPNNCGGHWPMNDAGAGGGGGGEMGAMGGAAASESGAAGGPVMSFIEPLSGGCEGGTVQVGEYSFGGGGGGGLQITSRTAITISGSGVIDASGGGAAHRQQPGGFPIAGAGGGGGGNVLLEAPQVILDGPAVVVSTKGGGGAGASTSTSSSGSDGGYDASPAPGGTSPSQSHGGRGGTGADVPFAGQSAGCSGCEAGGGGGAAGMTMFRNLAGAIAPQNGAVVRSKSMSAQIRTRLVP